MDGLKIGPRNHRHAALRPAVAKASSRWGSSPDVVLATLDGGEAHLSDLLDVNRSS
jgi:hypothetical protein